ncbi:MAG TPA: Omp28-related outer membrane protein [Flavobacteriales bacterium]|nr:Omp28-related outer membrane protein [Flavobacteriales bacterium]
MRRNVYVTCLLIFMVARGVVGQNYVYTQTEGTAAPYKLLESATTTIMEAPTGTGDSLPDQMSSWNVLPFAWAFYGASVGGYYVSDNGYIAFDSSASTPLNDTLPNVGGPNNAIYAFWDDIEIKEGANAVDKVKSWTYGQSPNRVHVIQWHSVTANNTAVTGTSSPAFMYAAIRIHECGDFDIIHPYANSVGWTATVGCENADGTLGTMIAGMAGYDYPSAANSSDPSNDVVYHFYYNAQPNIDLVLISETGLDQSIGVGSHAVAGTIENWGKDTVKSFDLNYTVDGGAVFTSNIAQDTIMPNGGSYFFTHDSLLSVATGGVSHAVKIWASNINGSSDELPCNDTLEKTVFVNNGDTTARNVLMEEFTGAWCGYCPDGYLELDDIVSTNANVVPVIIHAGSEADSMKIQEGLDLASEYGVTIYPRAMIDRVLYEGEEKLPISRADNAWMNNCASRANVGAVLNVIVTKSYNYSTRVIDATVTANFVDYATGDMRFNLYVVEDHIAADTGAGYDQVNYYSSQSEGAGGAAHPLYGFSNPILAYDHRYVLRAVPSGALGTSSVIPSLVLPSSSYSQNYSYTLPEAYNEANITLIGFVSYYDATELKTNEILNVSGPIAVGMDESPDTQIGISEIFPNPMNAIGFLRLNVKERADTRVVLYNIMGQQIRTVVDRELSKGSYQIAIDATALRTGVYYLNIYSGKDRATKKFVVAK